MKNKFYTCIGRNWMLFLELLKYFPKLCEKHLSSIKDKDLNAVWTESNYTSMDGKRIFSVPKLWYCIQLRM
ncbi:hypothetical protein J4O15_02290 [Lachnoanaerobaculum sp. Marseille-Q4761]|uniref:hypothetical protein n=1 Tax=Lachnoanaerobaculum sp. Marseille-Q4761 TaxID=2819511 RepID=UPI001AA11AFC|nr:hypothetical protein [Lachnoanaerobaculum sp. Marseille-Q4761]MBO1869809.1 hypothetical protein [Lachnoanaerobaculum sp. Marseille-Q4761]